LNYKYAYNFEKGVNCYLQLKATKLTLENGRIIIFKIEYKKNTILLTIAKVY